MKTVLTTFCPFALDSTKTLSQSQILFHCLLVSWVKLTRCEAHKWTQKELMNLQINTGRMAAMWRSCSRCCSPAGQWSTSKVDLSIVADSMRSCTAARCWLVAAVLMEEGECQAAWAWCWWSLMERVLERRLVAIRVSTGDNRPIVFGADGWVGKPAGELASVLRNMDCSPVCCRRETLFGRKLNQAGQEGERRKLGNRSDPRCNWWCKWCHRCRRSCNTRGRPYRDRNRWSPVSRWCRYQFDIRSRSFRPMLDDPLSKQFVSKRRGWGRWELGTWNSHGMAADEADECPTHRCQSAHYMMNEATMQWMTTRSTFEMEGRERKVNVCKLVFGVSLDVSRWNMRGKKTPQRGALTRPWEHLVSSSIVDTKVTRRANKFR